MNKTLVTLTVMTAASLFAFGTARAADETPADQQQPIASSTEAVQDSAPASQAPADAATNSEASASNDNSAK